MTVKEILAMHNSPNEVNISWNGDLIYFNFRNKIEVDVWGGFVVSKVCAMKEGVFELVLAAQPVRKGGGGKLEDLAECEQPHDQSEDEQAERIMSIIRLLNIADAKELGCIYHFALHLVRGSEP